MSNAAAKRSSWEDLTLSDQPFDLDADSAFLPSSDPMVESAPSLPGDFDSSGFEATYAGELERGGDQPVPRISIQAFCERPETAQILQAASTDRRISKANVTVSMGGLTGAIDFFAGQPSPNLIVVESLIPGSALIAGLERLAEHCEAGTKIIVIGEANDIGLYRELIRRGVSEYLVPPLQPLQLIRAISALYVEADKPFVGKTIAVLGTKGGAGASTIAHNMAWCMAESMAVNTTLVDLDLSWGTTGLDFNSDPNQGVADALLSPDRVDDVLLDRLLTRHTDRLTLFTAPASLDREYDLEPQAFETVIEGVRRGVPFVVLDLPHVWTRWKRSTVMAADEVILVSQPDLASLRNAKNLYDLLKAGRPHDAPPKVVLNMVGVPKRPEIPVKDFGDALGCEPILVLPFDPQLFGSAANNGQMLSDVNAQSKSAEGMNYLAQLITGRVPTAKVKPSLLETLKSLKLKK
jgi:pilus assembly protein CpaE